MSEKRSDNTWFQNQNPFALYNRFCRAIKRGDEYEPVFEFAPYLPYESAVIVGEFWLDATFDDYRVVVPSRAYYYSPRRDEHVYKELVGKSKYINLEMI